jgi:hypothetical protein
MAARRQRSHDECAEVGVQLVGGDDPHRAWSSESHRRGPGSDRPGRRRRGNHPSYFHCHS